LRYRGRTLATIQSDGEWPGMWRVRIAGRAISEMQHFSKAAIASAAGKLFHTVIVTRYLRKREAG
jgi:hypothetical protein